MTESSSLFKEENLKRIFFEWIKRRATGYFGSEFGKYLRLGEWRGSSCLESDASGKSRLEKMEEISNGLRSWGLIKPGLS